MNEHDKQLIKQSLATHIRFIESIEALTDYQHNYDTDKWAYEDLLKRLQNDEVE